MVNPSSFVQMWAHKSLQCDVFWGSLWCPLYNRPFGLFYDFFPQLFRSSLHTRVLQAGCSTHPVSQGHTFLSVSMSSRTRRYFYNKNESETKWGTENKLGGEQRGSVVLMASVHWRSDCLPLKAPVCFMHQPSATTQVYILGALSSFMKRAATVLQKESLTCWCQEPPVLLLCNN